MEHTTEQMARGRSRRARGFTLIEVLIVIFIVLALGGLVAYNLMGQKESAENDLCKADMNTLRQAMKMFRFDHGRYPTDEEGLRVLWDKEAMQDEEQLAKWKNRMEKPMPKDRFGHEWGYRQVSEHGNEGEYDLWSIGRDGVEGTEDDIVSWDKEAESGGGAAPISPKGG
jgi:general secretion pathway protein G